jgi:hypothetical protein
MSIAVEHERFILTATTLGKQKVTAFAVKVNRYPFRTPSGGNS